MKEVSYEILMNNVKTYISDKASLDMISKAFMCADKMHKGQKRQSGEDYIVHPLSVAFILSEMKADSDTICAALLHDTIEDTGMTKEVITNEFNSTVALLVDGVTKISKMNFSSKEQQVATNTRKIIMGLDADVRIVIIKLADRLHNMRTLQYKSEFKQKENALETMEIFVPLAYYLGIYQGIEKALNEIKVDAETVIQKMVEDIGNILADNNIAFEHKERIKSIYGLYKQMQKGKQIMDVHDLLAIKIIVEDIKSCYYALGLVHSEYPPINSRFKDYIASPKTNKYRSLHTTVFGLNDYLVQLQIRTEEMEKVNNYGIAAYWDLQKDNVNTTMQEDLKNHFQFFKSIAELNAMTTDNGEFVNKVKKELFSQSIYVYTTSGDIIELPNGSTPIDFAYKLDADVGNTMIGAIVNEEPVCIDYQLQNKDRVKIITDLDSYGPKIDWQDKAKTTRAKQLIKEFNRKKV